MKAFCALNDSKIGTTDLQYRERNNRKLYKVGIPTRILIQMYEMYVCVCVKDIQKI